MADRQSLPWALGCPKGWAQDHCDRDAHGAGEPLRVITSGLPALKGTVLEKRRDFRDRYDHLRNRTHVSSPADTLTCMVQ